MSIRTLTIREEVPLSRHTTFKTGGAARYFVEVFSEEDIVAALEFADRMRVPYFVLGGGSNLLVSDAGFDGLVIHVANTGISSEQQEEGPHVLIRSGSGGVWDDLVKYSVEQGYWGLENLSRIPGQVGAFAVQNVGAYGVEAKESVVEVEAFDLSARRLVRLSNAECEFRYRRSIFNTSARGQYLILSTLIRLSTEPNRRIAYPDLIAWFEGNPSPSQGEIRAAIMTIRDRKFPFPPESVEGNAGSFFKNVIIDAGRYQTMHKRFSEQLPDHAEALEVIRHKFPSDEGIRIPTAFILEACGLKGYGHGNVQLNPPQPMIVLNRTGSATSSEVMQLVQEVRTIVEEKTSLLLDIEPELVGFSDAELASYGFAKR